ncbi:hypothetical protein MHY85_05320 [Cellulomonas sp. ACRRI]|uniref:helix-turn-helix transcriptional regulator n=1 Tax=Cellulomonas sp. ACRRI TaxID=2918188 RepID=UPI001EF3D3D2|nr:hypothetical protein [Cellulomonas sp. ACRRI]MCG7285396.1 hypothetical protein [Cellulomonas sp. ACRRI]
MSITLTQVSYDLVGAEKATGISRATISAAVQNGSLIAHYVGAKATKPVFRAVELDEWVESLPTTKGQVA